ALEATRLGSYTEKSQRYILLDRDYVIPEEIGNTALEADFRGLLARQQDGYRDAYETLANHYRETQPEAWGSTAERRLLEGAAKEDARYFLGLATTGQVGVTLNARSLEGTIRRMAAHALDEVRRLGDALHRVVADIAPSLVRYTEATAYRRKTPESLRAHAGDLLRAPCSSRSGEAGEMVRLIDASAAGEELLLTALIHGHGDCCWNEARQAAERLSSEERRDLVVESLRQIDAHESPLRQFELPEFTFELVLSASCFAQLKRHRIASLICQPYNPRLGCTIPPSFSEAGLTTCFKEIRDASTHLYEKLFEIVPAAATYALTNAHRRRVIFKVNARELYHLSRLRLDAHAQWDIRLLAKDMIRLAQEHMPLVMMLAAGKDRFEDTRAEQLGS
ncbi:FAD-dependent thymidylate synthase, partial [Candidatus Eisenbacteria bacterium]